MTAENEMIRKSYYKTLIDTYDNRHPISILGERYMEEMKKQRPDLSAIRYAQGEVYFFNKDYEAAIYKWGTPLDDELIPWAQKNIADAHLEMGLLEDAEKFYKDVQTDSVVLQAEILLQLFSLYIQQDRFENAVHAIKNAIELDPDYPDVTEIAKAFFENSKDWGNAVELAVNEAVRTKSLPWFEVLEGYVDQGHTTNYEPSYFRGVLVDLFHMDKYRFESLTEVMWNSYKSSDFYIQWLEEINDLIWNHNADESYMWKKLPNLFKQSYFELISGRYLIRDIAPLIQNHLTNWLTISSVSDILISATAILAWDDIFESDLDPTLVKEAAYHFENCSPYQNGRQDGIELFESMKTWAEKEDLLNDLTEFIQPMVEEYSIEVASPSKIRGLIKASIEFLKEKRVEVEHGIMEKITWNEELLAKLNDIHAQMEGMESEEVHVIKDSFRHMTNNFTQNLMTKLPELLRKSADIVHEDSDFKKIHIDLNNEMNKQVISYMENTGLQGFRDASQTWIEDCLREFKDRQMNMDEMSESFNQQYGEEKITLEADFKILNDWQRDLERISRELVHMEKTNFMLRNNPSQLLLKGAGKLFGSMTKNKEMLHIKYKNYIENEDYSQLIQDLLHPFLQQLESFERSIEWDVNNSFSNIYDGIGHVSDEVQKDMENHKNALATMHEKPEIYRDPLTLFEVKLRQHELMNA
ncbi:tetratricopeptide repeat protein [Oceanobacillus limi]|uniref:tetratricopeptide repeat protein n=1 Tax=Oceanobacillus limi TaxID=930131 RepID=UPI000B8A4C90|nr:hypothetical protein [Oceanobacillus limi]